MTADRPSLPRRKSKRSADPFAADSFSDGDSYTRVSTWADADALIDVLRGLHDIPPGFPLFYRQPRLALPWGNSAYTSVHVLRWLPGDPLPIVYTWEFGPPQNGFTPSSEGPRRLRAIAEQTTRDLISDTIPGLLVGWATTIDEENTHDQ